MRVSTLMRDERITRKVYQWQPSNKNKLQIWGKAQRESTRHPKSDWGVNSGG